MEKVFVIKKKICEGGKIRYAVDIKAEDDHLRTVLRDILLKNYPLYLFFESIVDSAREVYDAQVNISFDNLKNILGETEI